MPSFDAARLQAMAQQVSLAAQSADWERLERLDAVMHRWLQEAASSAAPTELQPAWLHLAQAHAQALQSCSQARAEAAAQLLSLQHSQEAQKAYAWQEILE